MGDDMDASSDSAQSIVAVRPSPVSPAIASPEADTTPTQFAPEEIQRLWDRLLYEGAQHTNRVNFYLVAQSMFFAAFASNQRQTLYFSTACVTAGILMSLVWMRMAFDQDVIVRLTRKILLEHCPDYRAIVVPKRGRRVTQRLLSVYLPVAMILLWLVAGFGDLRAHSARRATAANDTIQHDSSDDRAAPLLNAPSIGTVLRAADSTAADHK